MPRPRRCFPSSAPTQPTASSWHIGASDRRSGSAQSNHGRSSTLSSRPRPRRRCSQRHSAAATASCSPTAIYEWKTDGKHKHPYRIMLNTDEPFAMAGIYAREPTESDTAEKNSVNFAILTTRANEAVSHIHDRMPVILPLGREKVWPPPDPSGMFMFPRIPTELLISYPVTPKMNRASFNETAAIAQLEPSIAA